MVDISKLSVYVAQMDVVAGQPSKNLQTMRRFVDQARAAGADLVVFPEMCVGGYLLADRWTDDDFVDYLASFNDQIRALSHGIGIIWGNVGRTYLSPAHPGKDGRACRYNMAFFAKDGEWVAREGAAVSGRYIKTLEPNYRMFDDERYFTSSIEDSAYYDGADFLQTYATPFSFEARGETFRIGVEVCEDLWSGDYAYDCTAGYVRAGCDAIVNISASPWTLNKDAGRAKRVREHVRNLGGIVPLLYVNTVGMQNTAKNVLGFDGGSTLYDAQGRVTCALRDDFEEEGRLVRFDAKPLSEPCADEQAEHQKAKLLDALVKTLRRFDAQVFPWGPKWIIGLSGGIDSSVNAALLTLALGGADRIVGYNLATRYNSDVTKANAYQLAQSLGITLKNGSIEPVVDATNQVLALYGYSEQDAAGLAQENIQARLRGHMLSTFAQVEGGVIMNNGNKVETLFGYATLYGDAIGAISPLGDVTKVRLFDLARQVNAAFGRTVVPENLIPTETADGMDWETPPSAELKDAQVDPMKWYYHDWLIDQLMDYPGFGVLRVMRAYAEDRLQSSPVAKWVRYYGLADNPAAFVEDLEWVCAQMRKNVFKRIQMPPNITVTRGSFGMDFRENQGEYEQTEAYRALRAQILAL